MVAMNEYEAVERVDAEICQYESYFLGFSFCLFYSLISLFSLKKYAHGHEYNLSFPLEKKTTIEDKNCITSR